MRTCSRKALKAVMIVLAMLITIITISFGVVSVNVEADTGSVTYLGKTYDTFEEAVSHWDSIKGTDGIQADKTVYLNEDITIESFACGEKNYSYTDPTTQEVKTNGFLHEIYIELNGHNLYLGNNAIEIINGSSMHINGQGSVITSGSNCFVVTYGSLYIKDAKIDGTFTGSVFRVKYGGLYFDGANVNLESSNDLQENGNIIDITSEKNKDSLLKFSSHIEITDSEFNVKYDNLKNLNYGWNVINGDVCRIYAENATIRVDIADNNHSSFTSNVIKNYGSIDFNGSEIYVTGESSNINSTAINSSTVVEVDAKKTKLSNAIISSQFTDGENVNATGINITDGMLEMADSTVFIKADDNVCNSAYCVKYKNKQNINQSTLNTTRLICDCNVSNAGTCMYSSSSTNDIRMTSIYTYSQAINPVGEIAKVAYVTGYTNQSIDKKCLGNSSCSDSTKPKDDTVNIDGTEYTYTYTKGVQSSTVSEARIGDRYYVTIYDAFDCAEDGDTIQLVKDINMIVGIEVNVSCTLDLNGRKITLKKDNERRFDPVTGWPLENHEEPYFTVHDCTFTVKGSANIVTEDSKRTIFYANAYEANLVLDGANINADIDNGLGKFIWLDEVESGSLTLKNSNIKLKQFVGYSVGNVICCEECKNFVMSGCNISFEPISQIPGYPAYGELGRDPIISVSGPYRGGTSNISGSTIYINIPDGRATDSPIISFGERLDSNNISNTTIEFSSGSAVDGHVIGVKCTESSELNADGLVIDFAAGNDSMSFTGVLVPSGDLNLKNSEIYFNNNGTASCIEVPSENRNGKVSVQNSKLAAISNNRGTKATCVINKSSNRIVAHKSYFYAENTKDASNGVLFDGNVYVTSGTYINKSSLDTSCFNSEYYVLTSSSKIASIAGVSKTFTHCVSVKSGLVHICSIGDTKYYDFKEALRHVKNDQTIIVNPSVEFYNDMETIDVTSSTTKASNFTIDFKDSVKTINMASGCTNLIHVGSGKTVTINEVTFNVKVNSQNANIIDVDNRANLKFTNKTQIDLKGCLADTTNSIVMINNDGKVSIEQGYLRVEKLETKSSAPQCITGIKSSNENIVSGKIDISFKNVETGCLSGIEVASNGESHLHEFVSGDISVSVLDCLNSNESYCIKDTGDGELVLDTTDGYFVNNDGAVIGRNTGSGKTVIKKGYYAQYFNGGENKARKPIFTGTFEIAGGYFTDDTLKSHCLKDFNYIPLDSTKIVTISTKQIGFKYRVAQANAYNVDKDIYGFIDDLVNTANDGNTIKIIQEDAEVNCIVEINDNITIDIDKYSLSTFEDDSIFNIKSGKTLTLKGNDASSNCYRNDNGAIAKGEGKLVVGKTNYYYKDKLVDDGTTAQIKSDARGATFSTDTTIHCDEQLIAKKNTTTKRYEIVVGPVFFTKNVNLSGAIQVVRYAAMRNVDNFSNIGFRVTRVVEGNNGLEEKHIIHRVTDSKDSLVGEVKLEGANYDKYKAYKQYQVIADDIAAKEIGDDVKFEIVLLNNSGEVIHVFHTATYSARDYAYNTLDKHIDSKLRNLLVAMLEYSSYAQRYFGWKTDQLVDNKLGSEDQAEYSKQFNSLECEASTCSADVNPEKEVGKQIILGSTISITFYIPEKYEGQYNQDDYSFTFKNGDYNTKFASPGTEAIYEGEVTGVRKAGDLYCKVKIEGIKLQNIDKTFSLQILDKNNASEDNYSIYKYSVMDYICNQLHKTSEQKTINLLKSLYLFGLRTQEYIK